MIYRDICRTLEKAEGPSAGLGEASAARQMLINRRRLLCFDDKRRSGYRPATPLPLQLTGFPSGR